MINPITNNRYVFRNKTYNMNVEFHCRWRRHANTIWRESRTNVTSGFASGYKLIRTCFLLRSWLFLSSLVLTFELVIMVCFVFGCDHQSLRDVCRLFRFPKDQLKQSDKLCRWVEPTVYNMYVRNKTITATMNKYNIELGL